jgi:toxin ParE1/3/4
VDLYRLRPRAREDRRAEVLYYLREAGAKAAANLVQAMSRALLELELNPAIGSPTLGKDLDIEGLRTWRVDGFPLSFWYLDRDDHIDVARLIGQRQDQRGIPIEG